MRSWGSGWMPRGQFDWYAVAIVRPLQPQMASRVQLRQESDGGLQVRHSQLASCLHFMEQEDGPKDVYLQVGTCIS